MKSNHDVLKEFHKANRRHRKVCFNCKNEVTYKYYLEQLKKKYAILQERGLVTRMVNNLCISSESKQKLFEYLAFNEWFYFSVRSR